MDETAAEPGALGSGAADLVCLKVAACGGITGLLPAAGAARAAGSEVYLASTFDGPLGIAAGLHAAAALRPLRHCGLATLALFDGIDDPCARRGRRSLCRLGPGARALSRIGLRPIDIAIRRVQPSRGLRQRGAQRQHARDGGAQLVVFNEPLRTARVIASADRAARVISARVEQQVVARRVAG